MANETRDIIIRITDITKIEITRRVPVPRSSTIQDWIAQVKDVFGPGVEIILCEEPLARPIKTDEKAAGEPIEAKKQVVASKTGKGKKRRSVGKYELVTMGIYHGCDPYALAKTNLDGLKDYIKKNWASMDLKDKDMIIRMKKEGKI